jgi:hypothetical protein
VNKTPNAVNVNNKNTIMDFAKRSSKVFQVPIAKMRTPSEMVVQRKFRKAHGDHISKNLDLNKLGIPVMNHRDGVFWILDGQHRIYAMRENGFEGYAMDCEVYENLTDAEMAHVFLGRDDRKAIDVFSKFHIACTAGHVEEMDIRRCVETQGLKISKNRGVDCVCCVSALRRVYDRDGVTVLGRALRTIRKAFGGDPYAFDANMIDGLSMVFNRFEGQAKEVEMGDRLSSFTHGVSGILRRAESVRMRTGNQKAQCVAAVAVEIYNKSGRGPKLPEWWKSAAATK